MIECLSYTDLMYFAEVTKMALDETHREGGVMFLNKFMYFLQNDLWCFSGTIDG